MGQKELKSLLENSIKMVKSKILKVKNTMA